MLVPAHHRKQTTIQTRDAIGFQYALKGAKCGASLAINIVIVVYKKFKILNNIYKKNSIYCTYSNASAVAP